MSLTRVSPALFQVSNNITSVTVGGSANTVSLTFDSNGVITGASNNALSVANTQITGLIEAAQIGSANASLATSGTLPAARLPAGSVIQVVNAYTAVMAASTSPTQATVLELSITPRSASNKIMISYHIGLADNNGSAQGGYTKIRRGGSAGTIIPGYSSTITSYFYAVSSRIQLAQSGTFIDSPATTSATTYGVYILSFGGVFEATGTTLILTEIQG